MDPTGNPPDANGTPASEALEVDPRDAELAKLRDELSLKDKKLDEVLRAYAQAKNEHAEFRTRLQRERDRLIDMEKGRVALAFLEAADELDRAIAASGDDSSPLARGVRLTREAMGRQMAAMGITPLVLMGRPFDPNVSEAVDLVPVDDASRDGVVMAEVTKGYKLGEQLLRPARVRVGKRADEART
ncbi:MAG: nucleotide exchange factor GrpE [Deltaproteobacteria bacterium]|nr:nucleotide exchange factor GrpE [Deltaproteobacteria bacterium]